MGGTLFYRELCLREKLINALLYEKRMQQNATKKDTIESMNG